MRKLTTYSVYLAFFSVCLSSPSLNATPEGGTVVNGSASFDQQGNNLTITNTPGTIINWQKFSIQTEETTRFVQQTSDSAVLNRVVGQDPSQILGKLQSNGRVFIVNPNGIVFGTDSVIDVSGLAASTLNLSNEDFLSQNLNFTGDGTNGNLSNEGAITTSEGGFVYLIASNVENHGVIKSPKGEVILAAGHSVQLVSSDNPDIRVTLTAPEGEALNVGEIITRAGKTSIYAGIINQQGKVSADSAVADENGKIFFKATQRTTLTSTSTTSANGNKGGSVSIKTTQGLTEVSGVVTATGDSEQGGEILILGEHVGIIDAANIDVSGQTGGGTILIGGDTKGANPDIQNAKATYVGIDTHMHADAVEEGDGGKVIVWSDDATRAYGTITAKGGNVFGDGGFVETSGGYLDVAGIDLDVSASNGSGGTWLLDPYDITIATTDVSISSSGTNPITYVGTVPSTSTISDTTINAQLNAGTSVIVDTTGGGADNGDITVTGNISKTSGTDATLTLNAHNDIFIYTNGISSTSGMLNVVLNADQGAPVGGSVFVTQAIQTNGGSVKLYGYDVSITAPINTSGGSVYLAPSITGDPISIGGSKIFDITQADLDNINAPSIYIGSPDGSTITSGTLDVATVSVIDAGAKNLYMFGSDNITIGNNSLAATGGILYFDNPVTGKTFTTGTGNLSANSIHITNNGLTTIGSGGLTSTNLTLIKSADVDIVGTVNAGVGNVYLSPYTSGSAISIGGAQAFDLSQSDLTNITANEIHVGVDQFSAIQASTVDVSTSIAMSIGAKTLKVASTGNMIFGVNNFTATGGDVTFKSSGGNITTGAGLVSSDILVLEGAGTMTVGGGGLTATNYAGLNGGDILISGTVTAPIFYLSVFTPSSVIGIGSSQAYNIAQADIDFINATSTEIGNNPYVTNTSSIEMATTAPIDFGARNVIFKSGNGMTFGANAFKATGGTLAFSSANTGFDITTGAGNIAANTVTMNSARNIIINAGGINSLSTISINAATTIAQNGNLTSSGGSVSLAATSQDATMAAGTVTTSGNGNINYTAGGNITVAMLDAGTGNTTLNASSAITDVNGIGVNNINANNLTVSSGGNSSLDYQITGTLNSVGVAGTADLRVFPAGSGTTTTSSTNESLTTTIATIADTTNTLSTGTTSTNTTTTLSETNTTDSSSGSTNETATEESSNGTTTSSSEEDSSKESDETSTSSDEKQPQTLAKKLPICK